MIEDESNVTRERIMFITEGENNATEQVQLRVIFSKFHKEAK